jgi:hypothetical protein
MMSNKRAAEVTREIAESTFHIARIRGGVITQGALLGSGFFVADNVVLVPHHQLCTQQRKHVDGDDYAFIQNRYGVQHNFAVKNVRLGENLHLLPQYDAALIRLPDNMKAKRFVTLGKGDIGYEVAIAGYPLAQLDGHNGRPSFDKIMFSSLRCNISSVYRRDFPPDYPGGLTLTKAEVLELNCLATWGHCGGAVYDVETAEVYGFIIRSEIGQSLPGEPPANFRSFAMAFTDDLVKEIADAVS